MSMGLLLIAALVIGALVLGLVLGGAGRRPGRAALLVVLLLALAVGFFYFRHSDASAPHAAFEDFAEPEPLEPIFHAHPPIELTAAPDTVSVIKAKLTKSTSPNGGKIRWLLESDPKPNEKAAKENAQQAARAFLAAQLREVRPDAKYTPSWNEVLKITRGEPRVSKKKFGEPLNETLYVAEMEIELSGADYDRLLRKLRLQEAGQREWLFAKGLLGILALLASVTGYFRFDEQTKGYYTGWLRVGAVVFLVAAGVGISMLP